jgi:hypothetical protein
MDYSLKPSFMHTNLIMPMDCAMTNAASGYEEFPSQGRARYKDGALVLSVDLLNYRFQDIRK